MKLLEETVIGTKRTPNRMAVLPMENNLADETGGPSDETIARYSLLADGGWGVVFVEATSVTRASLGNVLGLVLDERTAPDFLRRAGFRILMERRGQNRRRLTYVCGRA